MISKSFNISIIALGTMSLLSSLLLDHFHDGTPGIGFEQLAGIVIGGIIVLIGLRRLLLPKQHKWDWLLLGIYIFGLFYTGFRPIEVASIIHQAQPFDINILNKQDFIINVGGFIPFGFLAMAALANNNHRDTTYWNITIAAILGSSTSFAIEIVQYLLAVGRHSSLYDLLTNTIGCIIGISCYLVLRSFTYTYNKK